MKKVAIIFSLLFVCSSLIAQVEVTTEEWQAYRPKNTIYLSPFKAIGGEMKITYERQITKNDAFLVDLSGIYNNNNNRFYYDDYYYASYRDGAVFGGKIIFHYRNYIIYKNIENEKKGRNTNLYGLYVDAFAGYQYLVQQNGFAVYDDPMQSFVELKNEQIHAGMGGFLIGNRFDFAKGRITLAFDAGLALKISVKKFGEFYNNSGGLNQVGTRGVIPQVNVQFGFNF